MAVKRRFSFKSMVKVIALLMILSTLGISSVISIDAGLEEANLALNKSAVSLAIEAPQFDARMACDGNRQTRWASAEGIDPQWMYIDLGRVYTISRVKLYWETAYGKSYSIQVSKDKESWKEVYSTSRGNGGLDNITLKPVDAKYIKLYGTKRGTPWGYSLWEFQVYGKEKSNPQPTIQPTIQP